MQTRLRTGSLTRSRQQSVDTDDGRHRMGSLDFGGISDDAGAQLVAGLKDTNTDEVTTAAPLPPTTGMTTRRKSAARAIPVPAATAAAPSASLPGSHESSASGFVSGLMNTQSGTEKLSHTPPISNSFENQHFGKRPRSGVSHMVALICFLLHSPLHDSHIFHSLFFLTITECLGTSPICFRLGRQGHY